MKLREEVKFESNRFKISLINNFIVRVEIMRHTEVTLDDMDRNMKVYESFLNGRVLPFIVVFGEFSMANREVQKEFARKNRNKIKMMEAYVISSLPHRIMGNFHLKFFPPKHPTKMFKTEEEAYEWIYSRNPEELEKLKVLEGVK
ncbi:MAG: hypothetical protein KDC84_14175 [Crocinitomicaceae bacterium]|nr:hypothetical protein [Crocinitomicaceae bacterium]